MAKPIVAGVGIVALLVLVARGAECQTGSKSLPDAPAAQAAIDVRPTNLFVAQERSLPLGVRQSALSAFSDRTQSRQRESKTIFEKYLSSPAAKPPSAYHATSDVSLMGRATFAASRIFVTRDESGKDRLNTSYLLRALTSVAADTASRPYWRRSPTGSVGDFGSTVGNDAGMNVWHEFRPRIEQLMKNHAPKFVSRIEARVARK